MLEHILAQPIWLQAWIAWLAVVNLAAIAFLRQIEARWVLAALLGAALSMQALFALTGYSRLLGLSHVAFWTPLLAWLWRRRDRWPASGAYGVWLRGLVLTDGVSLLIDYVDVFRYLLGERAG